MLERNLSGTRDYERSEMAVLDGPFSFMGRGLVESSSISQPQHIQSSFLYRIDTILFTAVKPLLLTVRPFLSDHYVPFILRLKSSLKVPIYPFLLLLRFL